MHFLSFSSFPWNFLWYLVSHHHFSMILCFSQKISGSQNSMRFLLWMETDRNSFLGNRKQVKTLRQGTLNPPTQLSLVISSQDACWRNQVGFVLTVKSFYIKQVSRQVSVCVGSWLQLGVMNKLLYKQMLTPYPTLSFFWWHQEKKKMNFSVQFRKLMLSSTGSIALK